MNYSFVQTEGIQFDNSILHKKKQYMMLHKYKYITIWTWDNDKNMIFKNFLNFKN